MEWICWTNRGRILMRFLFVMLSLQASAGHSNILTRVWDKNNNFLQINISSALTTFGVNWQKSVFLNSDDLATQCCDCFFKENWTRLRNWNYFDFVRRMQLREMIQKYLTRKKLWGCFVLGQNQWSYYRMPDWWHRE